jgi:hypothetical protein
MSRRIARVFLLGLGIFAAPLPAQVLTSRPNAWPVRMREHVDLWLHGFALLSVDTAAVPLYRRGYRDAMLATRRGERITNDFDANMQALGTTLDARSGLIGAQFSALEYDTWSDFDAVIDAFLRVDGDARRVPRTAQQSAARLAAVFPSKEDRDFLRRFLNGLRSERETFHRQWWLAETRRRDAALARVDSVWQFRVYPALDRYLRRTQQNNGQIVLSTVLEAEGRTTGGENQRLIVAVGLPQSADLALDAISGILHELVNPLVGSAVDDNVTPAEKRSGVAARHSSMALVRGGAILASRLGNDVRDHYMRFYLRAAGKEESGDLAAAFARAFPLPEPMLSSIERQVNVAFSGI